MQLRSSQLNRKKIAVKAYNILLVDHTAITLYQKSAWKNTSFLRLS